MLPHWEMRAQPTNKNYNILQIMNGERQSRNHASTIHVFMQIVVEEEEEEKKRSIKIRNKFKSAAQYIIYIKIECMHAWVCVYTVWIFGVLYLHICYIILHEWVYIMIMIMIEWYLKCNFVFMNACMLIQILQKFTIIFVCDSLIGRIAYFIYAFAICIWSLSRLVS